jgi:hypothetical protein
VDSTEYHSPFSPLISELRQLFLGDRTLDGAFTLASIEGFSAGSLIGMSIFRLLAECGNAISTIPNKTTLGAIAMSPLLFFNFFELGRHPLPCIPPMARQSAWNPRKKLQKGATFVHYIRDIACPFSPTPAEAKQLFENNAHKLVLLRSKDCAYGKQGHNYDREYLALAELEDFATHGGHEVHTARMHVNVGDTQESLALLMVDLILTMGTKRLHSL